MSDLERALKICERNAEAAQSRRDKNREAAPELSRFVDDFRKVFGEDTKVRWVRWPDGTEEGTKF